MLKTDKKQINNREYFLTLLVVTRETRKDKN